MMRPIVCAAVTAVMAWGMAAVWADELGTEVDLTTFGREAAKPVSVWDDLPLEDVGRRLGTAPRRFYLSGMIGPSFAQVTSPAGADLLSEDTLFNAGGAIGVAFERRNGRLRIETEGMGRSTYDAEFLVTPSPGDTTILTNNWSVMENVWRDLMLTDRFGVYGGGGIGAGGYILGEQFQGETLYVEPAANFAWQFGGGLLWEVTERLAFDVGYRYFQIDAITQVGAEPNQFSASELMFTLRLYEPFRNWGR
jgi:opacity protein-like surface antigen